MAEKVLRARLKLNKKTNEELSQANPILKDGEVVLSTISSSLAEEGETVLMKIGDGSSTYDELPWLSALAADVFDWAKAESKPTYTKSEIGLGNVGNFKAVSTVASQGLSETEKSNARANIGAGTSSFSGSYNDLTNKPSIPTVGNGTITITQNGTTKGTFTLNQTGNATIELTDNNTTYGVASTSSNGLMSSADKTKLDGIEEGANNYSHPSTHAATMITTDSTHRFVTDSQVSTWNAKASTSVATTSANGLMSSSDKTKLDSLNNYSLPSAGTSLGGVKTGGDVTISAGIITVNDDSHSHTISNIDNLQTSLDSKVPTTRTINNKALSSNISLSASDVGAIPSSQKGVASGVASLDSSGKVPSSQLPSYVDDVLEFTTQSSFPNTGESGKIYIAQDTNKTYRWSGTAYVEISASLALGTTSSTAFRGDQGNTAYQHSLKTSGNPHGVTKADVGLSNVENKTSATIRSELTKENVTTALGYTPPTTNTTYAQATSTTLGLVKIGYTENGKNYPVELSEGKMFVNVPWTDTNTTYGLASTTSNGLLKQLSGSTSQFMRGDGSWATPPNTNTTYTLTKSGSTITLTGSDGSSTSVTDSNTTYSLGSFGVTATAAELNCCDGVTSNIQTQLNGKASTAVASTSANGLMSSADKTKLNGIATGANNYSHPTSDGNKHVPANGTTNSGKFLQATATAGTYQWTSLPTASTSAAGIVQLSSSTSSTSTSLAATASAVKAAYDLAASKANSSHTHNATQVTFTDGQTFQQKYDSGQLKGQKGDPGQNGENGLTPVFSIENGHLFVEYVSSSEMAATAEIAQKVVANGVFLQ